MWGSFRKDLIKDLLYCHCLLVVPVVNLLELLECQLERCSETVKFKVRQIVTLYASILWVTSVQLHVFTNIIRKILLSYLPWALNHTDITKHTSVWWSSLNSLLNVLIKFCYSILEEIIHSHDSRSHLFRVQALYLQERKDQRNLVRSHRNQESATNVWRMLKPASLKLHSNFTVKDKREQEEYSSHNFNWNLPWKELVHQT